eukprot:jgi/Ulvmu1/6583/UM003_0220.1
MGPHCRTSPCHQGRLGCATRPRARQTLHPVRNDTGKNIERAFLGEDFGARDATAGEVETNFSEKNIWNWDTEHLIRAPDAIGTLVGLGAKTCAETPADPVDEKTRELLRQQVPGWRVVEVDGLGAGIRRDWSAQGPQEAKQLEERFQTVASEEGHPIKVTCVASQAFAVLPVDGELSRRDFVLAAKLNSLDVSDLEKKKAAKYWA